MGGIAQLVEHRPFKAIVEGSSPSALTCIAAVNFRPHRLAWPRTPGFHPGNRGSNPLGVKY